MKKRTVFLVLAMTLGLSLVGCGNKNDSDCEGVDCYSDCPDDGCDVNGTCSACCVESPDVEVLANPSNKEELSTLVYKDVKFSLFSESDDVQKALDSFGKAKETDEYDAYERYTYDKFNFEVNKEEGKLAFTDFFVEDSAFKFDNGIGLGSSVEDVKAAFGEKCSSETPEGAMTYMDYHYEGDFGFFFTFENDKLVSFSMYHCF